jgi:hypothetical protein
VNPHAGERRAAESLDVPRERRLSLIGLETAGHSRYDRPEAKSNGPAGEGFDLDDDEQMRARLPCLAAIHWPTD